MSQRAQKIKLLICDIDGVFSDGRIYLGNQGEELKALIQKMDSALKPLSIVVFRWPLLAAIHNSSAE